jgi:hypothetical protein
LFVFFISTSTFPQWTGSRCQRKHQTKQ